MVPIWSSQKKLIRILQNMIFSMAISVFDFKDINVLEGNHILWYFLIVDYLIGYDFFFISKCIWNLAPMVGVRLKYLKISCNHSRTCGSCGYIPNLDSPQLLRYQNGRGFSTLCRDSHRPKNHSGRIHLCTGLEPGNTGTCLTYNLHGMNSICTLIYLV